ncbi:MAG: hypothetical protein EPO24_09350 [Bacteroidetes bacterium]|nr:MAG: hypothetical protein EPO24_09350 [Bacteroidota bacterium]
MKEILKTIELEGGYVNNPNDPGGETKFGISKRWNPTVDVKNLTKEQAIEIYRVKYWNPLKLDTYTCIQFRWKLFDIAVNLGADDAVAFLKKIKNKDTVKGVKELMKLQVTKHVRVCQKDAKQIIFLMGKMNRALEDGEDLVQPKT